MCSIIFPATDVMSTTESPVENSGQEDEPKNRKRKISLSNCSLCGLQEAKYKCPGCLVHSCSLPCVKKHKEDSSCSGIRNKTAFVALSQFDEMALLSDYRFLEDTGRFADGATRDGLVRTPRTTSKAKKLSACARRMNITLRFLPVTFTKSRENSTFCLTREKIFLWHLKLVFPQSNTEFSQRRVSDKKTLEQILTPYIHPTESDPVTRQKLKIYVQAPVDHVKVFMKAEGRKANSVRYHELDIQKTLGDNLSYKTLIEYPVLHVVLREQWKEYPLKGPACSSFAAKNKGVDQKTGDADICLGNQITSPEPEPPERKRAKRDDEEEEEGEIVDSSEEEDEGVAGENPAGDVEAADG
ncbi:box C/D snoRNA protein 1 [Takifugu rubripes]|uniref:box C/D snoRNA protein 1 n=1 Tax=Takifugu rubripes TaxID=31033 RepID=UPI0011453C87|nr:box C/D snoRNA protein 1 [Takifugu rubripes]